MQTSVGRERGGWLRTVVLAVLILASGRGTTPARADEMTAEERQRLTQEARQLNGEAFKRFQANDTAGALRLLEQSLKVRERLYPEKDFPNGHADLAASLNNLGVVLDSLGQPERALTYFQKALGMCQRLYPDKDFPKGHPDLAAGLKNTGRVLQSLGRPKQALVHFEKALPMYQRLYPDKDFPRGHLYLAQSLTNMGSVLQSLGQSGRALIHFENALRMYQRLFPEKDFPNGHLELAQSLTNMGSVLRSLDQPRRALDHYQNALRMYQRLFPEKDFPNGHPDLATTLNDLAGMLQSLGQAERALIHYENALRMCQRLYPDKDFPNGHPGLATSLNNLGFVLESLGQPRRALVHFENALRMRQRLYPDKDFPNGHPDLAQSVNNMGFVLESLGQPERALTYYQDALQMRQRLYPDKDFPNGHAELAGSLTNMGSVLHSLGQPEQALTYYQKALGMCERLYPDKDFPNGHLLLATSLGNMGSILKALGQPERALAYYQKAFQICQRLYPDTDFPKGHPNLAGSANNMGFVLYSLGQPKRALVHFENALRMYQRLYPDKDFPNGHPALVQSVNNLAFVLHSLGQPGAALTHCENALRMCRRLYPEKDFPNGHPELAVSLNNLAFLLESVGQPERALPHYQQALRMRQRLYPDKDFPNGHLDLAQSRNSMGYVLHSLGQSTSALTHCEKALNTSAALLEREAATIPEAEALDFARQLPQVRDLFLALTRLTRADAEATYTSLWPARATLTRVLQARHFSRNESDQARQLRTQLAATRARLTGALLRPLSDPQRDDLVRDLTDQTEKLERQLLAALAPEARPRDPGRPKDLAALLPKGSVFLDLLRYQDRDKDGKVGTHYTAFVLTPNAKPIRVHLGPAAAIDEAANAWRHLLLQWPRLPARERDALERQAEHHAAELRKLVWDKLAEHLPADTTIVYHCVEGDLARFPLAALPGDKAGTVLLERCSFASVLHGPFLLERLRSPAGSDDGKGSLLALGGIAFGAADKPRFAALPGTEREVQELRRLAGKRLDPALTGTDATVARLVQTLPTARYAHLATHGEFKEDLLRAERKLQETYRDQFLTYDPGSGRTPLRRGLGVRHPLGFVGLALAGANTPETAGPDGGILSGETLVGLKLEGLRLAVLSACETGLGANTDAEGVRGLQRAFHLAGCPDVVASLWQVNDEATAALMNTFWERILVEKQTPLRALREAQLLVYRRPDLLKTLANRGALNFAKVVKVNPDKEPEPPAPAADGRTRSHPYAWAAFFLSGSGL